MIRKYGDEKFLKETSSLKIKDEPAIIPASLFYADNFLEEWLNYIRVKEYDKKLLEFYPIPVYVEVDDYTYKIIYKMSDLTESNKYSVVEEVGNIELIDEDILKQEIEETQLIQSENKIVNLTDLAEQKYCPEEIQETLIDIVTQVPNLKVIWTGVDIANKIESDYSDTYEKSIKEIFANSEYEIVTTSRSINELVAEEKDCNVLYIELDNVNNNYYISTVALETVAQDGARYLTKLVKGSVNCNYATLVKLVMFEQYENTTKI